MPYAKRYRPRRPRRRYIRRRYRRNNRLARRTTVPRPKVYSFKRSRQELLALEDPGAQATGWTTTFDNSVVKTFVWDLASLPDHTEFTNLFEQYKLNMAVLKMFPTYSQVVSGTGPVVSTNVIITIWPAVHGVALTAAFDSDDLLQIQRKTQFMFPMNKPTTIKMPLKQLNNIYRSAVNTDYAVQKPRYINTSEAATPHYGMNVHIRRVDGGAFGPDSARLLIKEQVYLTTKQVK